MWDDAEVELCSNKSVISPAICAAHCPCEENISAVTLAGDDVVDEMPLFRTRVHPCCLELISQPERCVGQQQIVLGIFTQQKQAVAVHLPCPMLSYHTFPLIAVPANSGVEMTMTMTTIMITITITIMIMIMVMIMIMIIIMIIVMIIIMIMIMTMMMTMIIIMKMMMMMMMIIVMEMKMIMVRINIMIIIITII